MKVLITGTSSGIGFGLAKYYLDKGHEVIGISRTENQELINHQYFNHIQMDLSDFLQQKEALPKKLNHLYEVDLVVLNAGILSPIKDMKEVELDDFKSVMDINVWANKILLDIVCEIIDSVKQVVAISSGASVFGNRGWNAYSISKAALNMLIKLYANENPDIHFSAIAPGLVDTQMQDYICSLEKDKRYPSVERLKAAKGTKDMPLPVEAAPMLAEAFVEALRCESGSYIDVRDMF